MDLGSKKCIPCEGGVEPFGRDKIDEYMKVVTGWQVAADNKSISKFYKCKDFKTALAFVDKIGALAEDEGHHPDIILKWGSVAIELSTHAIKGLSENDFILAAKIELLK